MLQVCSVHIELNLVQNAAVQHALCLFLSLQQVRDWSSPTVQLWEHSSVFNILDWLKNLANIQSASSEHWWASSDLCFLFTSDLAQHLA